MMSFYPPNDYSPNSIFQFCILFFEVFKSLWFWGAAWGELAKKECKRTVEYKTAQNEPYHLKRVQQQSAPPRAYGQKGHQKRAAETNAGERSGC